MAPGETPLDRAVDIEVAAAIPPPEPQTQTAQQLLAPLGNLARVEHVRASLRAAATRIFGKDVQELPTLPGVDSLNFALRLIPQGRQRFIEQVQYAALNGDGLAGQWLQVYMAMDVADRADVSLDDICAMAEIRPSRLVGTIVSSSMQLGMDVAHLVRAFMGPEVVQKQMESAIDRLGPHPGISYDDRRDFLQSVGLNPVPRGTGVQVNVNAQGGQGGSAVAVGTGGNASANAKAQAAAIDQSVPSFLRATQVADAARDAVAQQVIDAVVVERPFLPAPTYNADDWDRIDATTGLPQANAVPR